SLFFQAEDGIRYFHVTGVQTCALPISKWWVDGWVPKGVTGILFAPPNTGKSFAAMDLACGVATGSRVWGRKASKGRVLFLAGEGHTGLPVRQEAWKHHFK